MKQKQIKRWAVNLTGIIICLFPVKTQAKSYGKRTYTSYKTTKNIKSLSAGVVRPVLDNSMLMYSGWKDEDNIYPSSDLYENSWDTDFLKAYVDLEVPDSFAFDVSDLVLPIEGKVTSHFGPRGRGFHYGTDIRLQIGDTIRAAFDGKVRVMKYERKGFGYYLVLRHFNGLETVYGHLSEFLVKQGQNIKGGQPIALGGNTGRATGPHLHFEFRFLGVAINAEEIIDFDELAIKNDIYVFRKGEKNYIDANHSINHINQYAYNEQNKLQCHRITKGDTLYSISKKYGITIDKLCKINQLKSESKLRIGNSIRIS